MPSLTRQQKKEQLDEILTDLEGLKASGKCENEYALEENIKFLQALYTFPKFIRWFFKERPKIDGSRLLELSDFHLHGGKWESILQRDLLEIEQWKFPDIFRHFRDATLKEITEKASEKNERLVLVSLGSGPMEIERQLIRKLRAYDFSGSIFFFGVDNSPQSIDIAIRNHEQNDVTVVKLNQNFTIDGLKRKYTNEKYVLFLITDDVFNLPKYFMEGEIDILLYSKFKHHLTNPNKYRLDGMLRHLASSAIENDDVNNLFLNIVSVQSNWFKPVLMNAALFSFLRDPSPGELKRKRAGWVTDVYLDGYVSIYKSKMSAEDYISKVIEAAQQAPSGDNCQPWSIEIISPNTLRIIPQASRDTSLFNYDNRALMVAHGVMAENIVVALGVYGKTCDIILRQQNGIYEYTELKIKDLESDGKLSEELYAGIFERVTNRKKYQRLSQHEISQFIDCISVFCCGENVTFSITKKDMEIKKIARAASTTEAILLKNKLLHNFFFNQIVWSGPSGGYSGMHVSTLGLNPVGKFFFKIFSNWYILEKMNRTDNISKKVASENEKIYATSSLMIGLHFKKKNLDNYFELGRTMQRVWLIATIYNIAVQPLTGISFLFHQLGDNQNKPLKDFENPIRAAYTQMQQVTQNKSVGYPYIGAFLRLGKCSSPQFYTGRLPLQSIIKYPCWKDLRLIFKLILLRCFSPRL